MFQVGSVWEGLGLGNRSPSGFPFRGPGYEMERQFPAVLNPDCGSGERHLYLFVVLLTLKQ